MRLRCSEEIPHFLSGVTKTPRKQSNCVANSLANLIGNHRESLPADDAAARPASSRATGIRNGEQET